MRLLNTRTLELTEFQDDDWPPYAILSHRWGAQEVSLQQLSALQTRTQTTLSDMEGYQKIVGFCDLAAREGFGYGWVDTCCIDKTSSAELSEAINSMFQWYRDANVCYAYLSDVQVRSGQSYNRGASFETMSASQWFTRGWTLQELIAPKRIKFYSQNWSYLGDKFDLEMIIGRITGIDEATLRGADIRSVSIARRMFWASKRITTRKEDIAYCLLGIFGVNMPLLYGEGERAFQRLQEEIMKVSDDQSLFAWEDQCDDGDELLIRSGDILLRGPLARSPAEFARSEDIVPYQQQQLSQPYAMTNFGLRIDIPLRGMRNNYGKAPLYLAELACYNEGDFSGALGIYIRPLNSDQYARDHQRRHPVVVNPQYHYPPVQTTIYLRKDVLFQVSEDFDRHHGFFMQLLPPSHGFKASYGVPYNQWMKTKGNSGIMLKAAHSAAVVFERSDETQIIVLTGHEQNRELYEGYASDMWEASKGWCRILICRRRPALDLPEGFEGLWGLDGIKYQLKYQGAPAEHFQANTNKSFAYLPDGRRVVAEMRKETVMGERMFVVDVTICETGEGLFELSGISAIGDFSAQQQQDALLLQESIPPQQTPSPPPEGLFPVGDNTQS